MVSIIVSASQCWLHPFRSIDPPPQLSHFRSGKSDEPETGLKSRQISVSVQYNSFCAIVKRVAEARDVLLPQVHGVSHGMHNALTASFKACDQGEACEHFILDSEQDSIAIQPT